MFRTTLELVNERTELLKFCNSDLEIVLIDLSSSMKGNSEIGEYSAFPTIRPAPLPYLVVCDSPWSFGLPHTEINPIEVCDCKFFIP
mgnify:CR=1 FL=1